MIRHPRLVALAFALAPAACATPADRHADAACEALRACSCGGAADHTDIVSGETRSCEQRLADDFDARAERLEAAGLLFDEVCLEWWIDHWPQLACATIADGGVVDERACGACRLFHGARAEGEPCEYGGGGQDDCAQGLVCQGERCVDPCARHLVGEVCGDGIPCEEGSGCHKSLGADEFVCTPVAGRACEVIEGDLCVATGPPCPYPYACVEGSCAVGRAPGEACTEWYECAWGSSCASGVCSEPGELAPLVCEPFAPSSPVFC